jgi:OOP family OmpA-OmpF porin
MSRRAKLAISFLFFFLLGWIYINVGRVPGSARELELKLAAAAQQSLDDAGLAGWARVDMNGRTAMLRGLAPDDAARRLALEAIRHAVPGGGIATVEDHADLMGVAAPYTFEAIFDEGRVTMSGYAPDRGARDSIIERARSGFDDMVDADDLAIATGAPEGGDWRAAVDLGLAQLARLRRGVLWIEDERMSLEGLAASPQVAIDVTRQTRLAPPPFTGRARIEVAYANDAAGSAQAREACQREIDALMDEQDVRFQFDGAEISPESDALLDAVAVVARRCGQFHLLVGGHTAATGEGAFNVELSERRARAVADYLAREGVDPAGLEARGFGGSQPIADSDDAVESAQNQRIQITVIEPTEPRP